MKFDVYFPTRNKEGKWIPGVVPRPATISEIETWASSDGVKNITVDIAAGKKERKPELPAICWVGTCKDKREASKAKPTQFVMIDIDHAEMNVKEIWYDILDKVEKCDEKDRPQIAVVHGTPSGKGLRIVFCAREGMKTLRENMEWFKEKFYEERYGGWDSSVKDLCRLSFMPYIDFWLYINEPLLNSDDISKRGYIVAATEERADGVGDLFSGQQVSAFTDEEKETFEAFEYRGTPIKTIIAKYVEVFGEPSTGEKHNYYNEMVKYFRCICDNNKRLLLYLLPPFGHSLEERNSQINSICRVNTLSSLPKKFYFFLKDNGFYNTESAPQGKLKEYMMSDEETTFEAPPYLPPIFREFVNTAPRDFVVPCVNALLPILGTLTSYVKAVYPYDSRYHTTSFFSVIYAPPGTGKGFVERFMETLFVDLRLRDLVQSERENIYLRTLQRKGANDKAPDSPHTSLRLIPAKNSEAEFLQKQRDNQGYHMFTYAAEMDSWAKGVRAAGGNKDDMIRIAWDNGEYGQQFKSFNTFKGVVNLYWNVLITGTLQQVESYFKNVENGLVTRCSFTSIENQEFATPPRWKKLTKRALANIAKFTDRCDRNTYDEPCNIVASDLIGISDDDFDNQVDWKFKFRARQERDMSWIMPVIDEFHKEQMEKAALDIDRARDVFRRRVGVRGFRLALLCTCLWENPKPSDLEKCKAFVKWWMHQDIESTLKLWGEKYNSQAETTPKLVQRTVFNELPQKFTKSDVYVVCTKQGIKTPIRRIIFDWKKLGYIEVESKDVFIKK